MKVKFCFVGPEHQVVEEVKHSTSKLANAA